MNLIYPNFEIHYKKVKRLTIKVVENKKVIIIAPLNTGINLIQEIVTQKKNWIENTLAKLEQKKIKKEELNELYKNKILLFGNWYIFELITDINNNIQINNKDKIIKSSVNLLEANTIKKFYTLTAKQYLPNTLLSLAHLHKFKVNKITIRNQKTRWASCSNSKNISLNARLVKMPSWVINYVCIHELVHTKIMNHRKDFWDCVQNLCPEYKKAEQWIVNNKPFL